MEIAVSQMVAAHLIVEQTDIPGKPVVLQSVRVPHSCAPPVEEVVVEGVDSRLQAQDVDSGAKTQMQCYS